MEHYEPVDPGSLESLRSRGYDIDDIYANHAHQLLYVVSGPGLDRFGIFASELNKLAHGRTSPEVLVSRRLIL